MRSRVLSALALAATVAGCRQPQLLLHVTTDAPLPNGRARMWRLRFADITNPVSGGQVTMVLDGTEGGDMYDNICVDKLGHVLLCDSARRLVDRLTILVCSLPDDPIPGPARLAWMRELFPTCRVIGHDVPGESVVVRLAASGQTCRCSRADVCAPRRARDDAVAAGARATADEEGTAPSDD